MKGDHALEWILRVYPRAFRNRFGSELRALYADSSKLERRQFLSDLFLGAVGERLQSMQWLRFVAAVGLALTCAWSLANITFFQDPATSVLSSIWFIGLATSGWLLLPFALIARLNRTPTWAELCPLVGFPVSVIALIASSTNEPTSKFFAFLLASIYYGGLALYGCTNLRHSSPMIRLLKLSVAGHGLGTLLVTWAILLGVNYRASWALPWEVTRAAFTIVTAIGLVLPITQPRATATPATYR